MAPEAGTVYQLKISLEGSKPPIWRRVLIRNDASLDQLHRVIQIAMGWTDTHLNQFIHGDTFYSSPNMFGSELLEDTLDARDYTIRALLRREKDWLRYEYDFGDSWLHKVTLEKVLPADAAAAIPACLKARGACPPEDCGGIWGYAHLLATFKQRRAAGDTPDAEDEDDELMEWLPADFDPDQVDLDGINQALRRLR
ncbi:MAG: plasmid pRiA4b ORF-3 family protein [Thiothrix sp.]|nr:plasmid pRiA4b ORF-3 family protein [Thiothrix sp.]HPE61988.1 plasmid pRiA4b ORF-3 family protein [Thiolinea sp.]